jgi:alkylhydroperoxidase/carboxymuconolactone decarboxylase family protein YurZ
VPVAISVLGAVEVLRMLVTAATTLVGVTPQLITVLVAEVAHALKGQPLLEAVTGVLAFFRLAFQQPVIP